jgi:hypothetical protein
MDRLITGLLTITAQATTRITGDRSSRSSMDGAFMADVASMAARAASAAIDARLIISWGRFCRKFASGPWQIDNRWPELQ